MKMSASEKYEMMLMYQHTYNWSTRRRGERKGKKKYLKKYLKTN